MARVGVVGDTHLPFELEGYLQFVKKTFKKYGVTRVIHIGDLVDHHALSFHDSEPMLMGAHGEMMDARERLKPWYKAFPKLEICGGNHDLIPQRQLKKIGMDSLTWMRPLEEVYNFPKGWKIIDSVTIDNVLYHHGMTACGVNGFRNDAKDRMCSTVTGHAHGNFGVSYSASENRLVFGMAVGCGIDVDTMAFVYGRHFKQKPIVGCGVVINGHPIPVPMDLGGL